MTVISRIACCLVVLAGCVATASAQGKNKPPQKYYGEAVFRCPISSSSTECAGTDRIEGDLEDNEAGYRGLGWAGAGLFSANSDMHIGLNADGGVTYYRFWLDFRDAAGPAPCALTNTCAFPLNKGPLEVSIAEIQGTLIDENGAEIPGGLFATTLNVPTNVQFRIGFRHPDSTTIAWRLFFNPFQYTGADFATVTRVAACTWVFEATHDQLAGLWRAGQVGGKGKTVRIDEGLFRLPFKLTFKAYDAPGCLPRP